MSSDKQREKRCHLKLKVCKVKLIFLIYQSVPKKNNESYIWWEYYIFSDKLQVLFKFTTINLSILVISRNS